MANFLMSEPMCPLVFSPLSCLKLNARVFQEIAINLILNCFFHGAVLENYSGNTLKRHVLILSTREH